MRPVADVTARARIRDAAMQLFADLGDKATTIRAVAERAGVTPGLVSHHFGNKRGLRDACHAHVLDYIRQIIAQGVDEQGLGDPAYFSAVYESSATVVRYAARAFVDDAEGTSALFDNLVGLTEEYLASHPPNRIATQDLKAHAAVLVAMRLGVWMLQPQLIRTLGGTGLSPQLLSRLGAAELDIISPDLAGPDLVALARTGLERFQRTTEESE